MRPITFSLFVALCTAVLPLSAVSASMAAPAAPISADLSQATTLPAAPPATTAAATPAVPDSGHKTLPANLPQVGFAIIKTGKVAVAERLLQPDGAYGRKIDSNFSAFLIKHGTTYLLFDSGLGQGIAAQYQADMTWWQRPFFKYEAPLQAASVQLQQQGYPALERIILSHSHWDHAGGVPDFPQAKVMIAAPEMARINHPTRGAGGTWASQVASPAGRVQWETLHFENTPYQGYAQSLDWFHDGSVVLVPMPGHTPGSVGLFITVDSGQRYFFIGDVAWTVAALKAGAGKFWAAAQIVDDDHEQTEQSADQVRKLMAQDPALTIVPAHDSAVQDRLGYFPAWVK
jgi:glyoxylase-like metal-dependent hydrolase (beta-lactamase superfamily II)